MIYSLELIVHYSVEYRIKFYITSDAYDAFPKGLRLPIVIVSNRSKS